MLLARYYQDVQQLPSISEQDMQSMLYEESMVRDWLQDHTGKVLYPWLQQLGLLQCRQFGYTLLYELRYKVAVSSLMGTRASNNMVR